MKAETINRHQTTALQTSDLASLLQSLQAISRTIHIDELISQLISIILNASGADRCALLLADTELELQVRAISTCQLTQLLREPLNANRDLPIQIIQQVHATQALTVIDDAHPNSTIEDEYLTQQHPRSVLCLPMMLQRHLIGVLYLEHHSDASIFSDDRIAILQFLGNHATISIENARAIEEEREKNAQLLLSELRLRTLFEQAGDAVVLVREASITDCNQAALNLFGFATKAEFCATSLVQLSPPHQPDGQLSSDKLIAVTQEALKIGSHCFEWIHRRPNGEEFWAEVMVTLIPDGDSHVLHGVVRDISDRKQLEATTLDKSHALEQVIEQLQAAQLQMVQSEKMSALGNLVAGIAHEINNPLGFISGNMKELSRSLEDIKVCLQAYREAFPQPGEEIEELLEEVDIDFLLEDLPNMLNSMNVGCQRIHGISNSLRTFSRADQETQFLVDLHEGLESTLLILKYRLKDKDFRPAIQVIQDYADLPEIKCFPGQLNQVFMNVLANAIDMFDEMAVRSSEALKQSPPQITIQTERMDEHHVAIRIRDNGQGMNDEVQARIFDREFTTKAVGKGTGLGMAIAQQIVVDTHGGILDVQSTIGEGTEFRICLPIDA